MQRSVCILLFLASLATAAPLGAQEGPPVSLDLVVGPAYGRGGAEYQNRSGVALDGTLAWRARAVRGGSLLLALSAGRQGGFGSDLTCLPLPGGGCTPDYPRFRTTGGLIGWEIAHRRGAGMRLMAGPTHYRAEDGGGRALGIQGRIDAATPSVLHLALVGSVRADMVPSYDRHALLLGALALGVRIQ